MERKLLALFILMLSLCLCLALASCGDSEDDNEDDEQNDEREENVEDDDGSVSEGLEFELSEDEKSYVVTGIGKCKDANVVIPDEYKGLPVTGIGYEAFRANEKIESVIIPNGVTSIGEDAFRACQNLEEVIIPDSVSNIGVSAFNACEKLNFSEYDTALYLGNEENPYLWLMKAKNYDITSCNINKDTKHINFRAFFPCESLVSVSIPNGLISIGDSAFADCRSLIGLVIPSSVTSIGEYAFDGGNCVIYCAFEDKPDGWSENWVAADEVSVIWGYEEVSIDIVGSEITKDQWEEMRNTTNYTVSGTSVDGQYENEYRVTENAIFMNVADMEIYSEKRDGVYYTIMNMNDTWIGVAAEPYDYTIQGMLLSIEMSADTFDLMTFDGKKGCYQYVFKDAPVQGDLVEMTRSGVYEFYFVDGVISAIVLVDDLNAEPQIVYITNVGTTEVTVPEYTVQ